MDHGLPKPEESLDSLKRRVDDAKLRLDFASQHLKEVHSDHRSGEIPATDPDAREHAIRTKHSARAEYLRILKIYEDFAPRGKAAHNGAGPQAQSASAQPDSTRDGEEP